MILDTSALIAVLFGEPEADPYTLSLIHIWMRAATAIARRCT